MHIGNHGHSGRSARCQAHRYRHASSALPSELRQARGLCYDSALPQGPRGLLVLAGTGLPRGITAGEAALNYQAPTGP